MTTTDTASAPQTIATPHVPTPQEIREESERKEALRQQRLKEKAEREKKQQEEELRREEANWQQAVRVFQSGFFFPDDEHGWNEEGSDEKHTFKGRNPVSHPIKKYSRTIAFMGYPGEAKYSFCPECNQIWTKFAVITNSKLNRATWRWYIKHGKSSST